MVPEASVIDRPTPAADDVVLRLSGVTKSFGGPPALRAVDLEIRRGRVHALLGMNGAGKSTLVQIISGSLPPTEGRIELDDVSHRILTPRRARAAGIATVHQRRTLVPSLTVAENVLLGEMPGRAGFVDWSAARRIAAEALAAVGVELDPRRIVGDLGAAQQTLVEIAREVRRGAQVVILDEPTAAIGGSDARSVHAVVRALAADGVAVVYISHHLDEVLEIADDVTVLRDGVVVLDRPIAGIALPELVKAMVGDEVKSERADRTSPVGDAVLELTDLSDGPRLSALSLTVHAGEIVAVLGPAGAAQESLFPLISGLRRPIGGTVSVAGKALRGGRVRDSLAAGLRCVSVDRLGHGLIAGLSVAENITALEHSLARRFVVNWRAMSIRATELRRRFNVVSLDDDPAVERLSGGNQQKVLLGKWLAGDDTVACLLEEPSGGVDVSAKVEIHRFIEELAAGGAAVLLASSDVDEVLRLADRIVVVRGSAVVAERRATETDREELVAIVLGGQS